MKYFIEFHDSDGKEEVSKDEALHKVLGTFRDCDEVRDWLTIPNCIVCRFSTVYVVSDDNDGWDFNLLLLNGTQSREDVRYDELTGNRA